MEAERAKKTGQQRQSPKKKKKALGFVPAIRLKLGETGKEGLMLPGWLFFSRRSGPTLAWLVDPLHSGTMSVKIVAALLAFRLGQECDGAAPHRLILSTTRAIASKEIIGSRENGLGAWGVPSRCC